MAIIVCEVEETVDASIEGDGIINVVDMLHRFHVEREQVLL